MQPDTFSPVLFKVPRWQVWWQMGFGLFYAGIGMLSLKVAFDHRSTMGSEIWLDLGMISVGVINFLLGQRDFRRRNLTLQLDENGFTYTFPPLTTRYSWHDVTDFRYGRVWKWWPKSLTWWIDFSLRESGTGVKNSPISNRILNKFNVPASDLLATLQRYHRRANDNDGSTNSTSSIA